MGLRQEEAARLLAIHGENRLRLNEERRLLYILRDVVKEPMFLLLSFACSLYFLLGEAAEGTMMLAALLFVAAISVYQELKTANALAALQSLTEPRVTVFRDGAKTEIQTAEVVPGDWILVEEGQKFPADGRVMESNDLTVNEGILTGEAFPVDKDLEGDFTVYQGTVVNSGRCIARVEATGGETALGKLGKSVVTYAESKTVLQQQIEFFVRRLALFGLAAFALIFTINYFQTQNLFASLLFGLTLAMSAIPEEIPVAFSSFMALGAHALSKMGIITRQPMVIETLGAVNVICLDKTGTITENKMAVDTVYHWKTQQAEGTGNHSALAAKVLHIASLASEQTPFDAMEKAIIEAGTAAGNPFTRSPLVKEYPLEGRPPMMTHVYQEGDHFLATAKGGVERLISACRLSAQESETILAAAASMAAKGHRVMGVARAQVLTDRFPQSQEEFDWRFVGLLSLADPPKPSIGKVLQDFYNAGIQVKLLTGDYHQTAEAIANQVGLQMGAETYTGEAVMQATPEKLAVMVGGSHLFTRMFPEAKRRVVKALQDRGNIVAMTGDGVNDGPALKTANIGIALGKNGTEVARQAADLILTDDNLQRITEAIRQGRKIFSNLKKAIRYIVSIHIPIILVASLPLLFGWKYPNIFTPIHVIFLELIMGPTCSVFYEREPVEPNSMHLPPRKKDAGFFDREEIGISVVQGLVIAFGVLLLFFLYAREGASQAEVRTIVFTTLVFSNVFLTFTNRSFTETILHTFRYRNGLTLPVLLLSFLFLASLHLVPFVQGIFGLAPIAPITFFVCFFTAVFTVGWFEWYKANLDFVKPTIQADHKQPVL